MTNRTGSSLQRTIDPRRSDHATALLLALCGGILSGVWQRWHLDASWSHASVVGIRAGVVTFLAWACTRELDPDHPLVAHAAAPIAALLALLAPIHLVGSALAMLALRIVAGTTGRALTILDVAWMPLVGIWAATQARSGVVAALALVLALGWALRVGHVLIGQARRAVHVVVVALALATCTTAVLADHFDPRWSTPHGAQLAVEVGVLVVAALTCFVPVPPVRSRCDDPVHTVATAHVRAARVLAAAMLVAALALGGVAQLASLAGVAAALLVATATSIAAAARTQHRSPSSR